MPDGSLDRLKREGRIVVVGASLAGLRAAETLRDKGFEGTLTMIGDEPYEPYDRPPCPSRSCSARPPPTTPRCPAAARSTPSGGSASRPVASTWRPGASNSPTATRCPTTG